MKGIAIYNFSVSSLMILQIVLTCC